MKIDLVTGATMEQDIPEIVSRASRGERQALSELYDRFAPLVRAVCYDRIGDLQSAWDVAQEVFLTMLVDLEKLKDRSRFQPWLMGVTRNKVADFFRKKARAKPLEEDGPETPPARNPDPAEEEQLSLLKRAVRDLPERERLVVQLFYIEGRPAREIASLLAMPLRTVYASLAPARDDQKRRLNRIEERISHEQ